MNYNKDSIEGIILIVSCQKHQFTRLMEYKLSCDTYSGWKVINVIGDLFLEQDYILNGNTLTIKCEDSYIHLLKKIVLALKYLYNIFDIKQGVLRCGDDVIFNEDVLIDFLNMKNKPDYYGNSSIQQNYLNPNISNIGTVDDYYMVNYYLTHPEDFNNPNHNLKDVDISKYIKRPHIENGAGGNLFYISNKSCCVLIEHMENINYNIFHYDTISNSYAYTIEDCAVSYILYSNNIDFIHSPIVTSSCNIGDLHGKIGISTDKYK